MKHPRKIYKNKNWLVFSEKVKQRDNYKCLQCQRDASPEVILQVHHEIYIPGREIWEYSISDCRTLCRGCHAREHGIIQPNRGWTLISIDDLGELGGVCERNGCGAEIRYEHLAYHPKSGYMIVGSRCIEILTQEDNLLSREVLHIYKNISNFVHSTEWRRSETEKGNPFIYSTYKHHIIRIYGKEFRYAFQLVLKEKGARWYNFGKIFNIYGKNATEAKELSYIALRGTLSDSEKEKKLLRELYCILK